MTHFKTSLLGGIRAGLTTRTAKSIILSTINLRTFCASAVCMQANLSHPLIWSVDWALIAAGRYAVVDPHDPTHLTYLREGEYHRLSNVMATNEDRLIVVAHPLDPRPKDSDILAPKPNIPPSPSAQGSSYFYRGLRSRLGSAYRAFLAKGKTMLSPDKMTEHLLVGFIIRLVALTAHFTNVKELRSVNSQVSQHFASTLRRYYVHKGMRGVVLLLKFSSLLVLQYLGKTPKISWEYGFPVRLAHGLPAWLPLQARHAIRSRCPRVIRFWLSLMYIYKILAVPYDVGKALSTISAAPLAITPEVQTLLDEFRLFLRDVWVPSIGGVRPLPKDDRYKHFTPVSAGPNGAPAINHIGSDALAWMNGLRKWGENWPLWLALREASYLFKVDKFIRLEMMEVLSGYPALKKDRGVQREPIMSRVHLLAEPAGKVRAVGIIDIFTQRILRPLHDDLFLVLDKLPWDGTMSQNRLMDALKVEFGKRKGSWSSIDISSATDLIPRQLYEILIEELYGKKGRKAGLAQTVLTLMTDREFAVSADPALARKGEKISLPSSVSYGRGQPMGCLGSFALLGLWNNAWVGFASYKHTGKLPVCYGVTGDDVVIFDKDSSKPVALNYIQSCKTLGIPISIPKSFASSSLFNFLSRTVITEGEVSPLSWKEELTMVTASDRMERALKLRDRDYWSSDGDGWLSKAVKYFLAPTEYLLHVKDVREGTLSGYGLRAVLAYLVPSSRCISSLGLQGVSIFSLLSACAGSVACLSHGQSVREDSLGTPIPVDCQDTILDSLVSLLTSEITELYAVNDRLRTQYGKWHRKQHPCISKTHFSELFLPSPDIFAMGGRELLYGDTITVLHYDEMSNESTVGYLPRPLMEASELYRPNNPIALPGKEREYRVATLNFMIRWLEEIPIVPNYGDIDLFANASLQLQKGKVGFQSDLSRRAHRIFSAVWQAVLLSGGTIDLDIAPGLVAAIERQALQTFGYR